MSERILVVTTSYPRWPGDSAGSFVEGHVRAMRALGHHVDVLSANDIPSPLFQGSGAPDALEHAPHVVDVASFMARLTAAVLRRARSCDRIVAHWLPCALAALPARKPLTAIAHGGDVYTLRRLGLLRPTLFALRHAKLVFVGAHLPGAERATIVQPMGIDVAHFAAIGRAPTTPPTILVVARLVPIKGVDVAIDAAKLLGIRLVIAGDGPERAALEQRAGVTRADATRADITFLGAVDTARRDQLLREATVVVVPSRTLANGRREGCPTIALEALAAGVPVISTIGRANEIVPADDPGVLADAIRRVIASPPPTRHLVADLDWPAVAGRLLRNE